MRAFLAVLLVALAGCAGQASPLQAPPSAGAAPAMAAATGLHDPGTHPLRLTVEGETATGILAVPASGSSATLVVLAQGYTGDAQFWGAVLQDLADHGVLAVAMDYRGPKMDWKASAGAADVLAATAAIKQAHPEVRTTILAGYSMGGEVSGLALARAPRGTYDYWIAGSGVMDLAGEWRAAVSFQPAIERQAGGRPDQAVAAYAELSPLGQEQAIAGEGLRRAYLVHGAADTVVPLDQAERMAAALEDGGVPLTFITVATEADPWVCTPEVILCTVTPAPIGPANHEAGVSTAFLAVLHDRVLGQPDPAVPTQHVLLEGVSGSSVTW